MNIKSIFAKAIKDSAVAPVIVIGGVCKVAAVTLITGAKGARKTAEVLDGGGVYCAIKGAEQDVKVASIRAKQEAKVRQTAAYNASCDVYNAERELQLSQRKFESAKKALAGNTITETTPEKVFVQEVMNASA